MRTRMSAVVVAISVLVTLIAAQSPRGQLAGTITDASGGVLPGVTVTLSGVERRTTVTNDSRRIHVRESRPGRVRASRGATRVYERCREERS